MHIGGLRKQITIITPESDGLTTRGLAHFTVMTQSC
jgi:hypothetical protein